MEDENQIRFCNIVASSRELPQWVRERTTSVRGLEERVLDSSYLNFLNEQIELSPRGPEWTEILKKRRDALSPFCGKSLLSGFISDGTEECFIKIDPVSGKVLYHEIYDRTSSDTPL